MMRNKQLVTLITFLIIGQSYKSFAQEKGDFGLLISPSNNSRIALEYRRPINEHFRFKGGISMEDYEYSFSNPVVVEVTDSTLFRKTSFRSSNQYGIRLGVERRLKSSPFSIGADLNLHYRKRVRSQGNEAFLVNESGDWVPAVIIGDSEAPTYADQTSLVNNYYINGDFGYANIKEHFLVPGLRTSVNFDVPIYDLFMFHLSVAGTLGLPIYMGAASAYDPNHVFQGSPPSVIEFDTNWNIGLRYNIGAIKKRRLQKKANTER